MADDDGILGSLFGSGESTSVKTNEITGKQYAFHSVPREIENATNSYYVMEKKNPVLEESIISKAFLYDIRLYVIKDVVAFVLLLTLFLASFSFKYYFGSLIEDDIVSIFINISTIIPMGLFFLMLMYTASHMKQYAIIEAHAIGHVTGKIKSFTSDVFYSIFFFFFIAMQVIVIIIFSLLESMLELFKSLYGILADDNVVDYVGEGPSSFIEVFVYVIENGIELNSIYSFFYSFYFIHVILTIFSIFVLLIVKEKNLIVLREESSIEHFNDKIAMGYAFDKAVMVFEKIEENKQKELEN